MNTLLEISIMGSVMVVLVLLIRMVLQNRVRRSTILLFWMITLAQCVCTIFLFLTALHRGAAHNNPP